MLVSPPLKTLCIQKAYEVQNKSLYSAHDRKNNFDKQIYK